MHAFEIARGDKQFAVVNSDAAVDHAGGLDLRVGAEVKKPFGSAGLQVDRMNDAIQVPDISHTPGDCGRRK